MKLLVVEDQEKMASFLKEGLTQAGFEVDVSHTGSEAQRLAKTQNYDLLILDVGLPDQSGLDTAKYLREGGYSSPIIMLTAQSGTKDKIMGLDSGADDYLTKPFVFEELLARIRALLRRNKSTSAATVLKFFDIEMNLVNRKVTRSGQDVGLTQKEFALLELFLRNPNRIVTRAEISEQVWGVRFDPDSNVIDVYMNMLRKKVDVPFSRRLLHTIVGEGYTLREEL